MDIPSLQYFMLLTFSSQAVIYNILCRRSPNVHLSFQIVVGFEPTDFHAFLMDQ